MAFHDQDRVLDLDRENRLPAVKDRRGAEGQETVINIAMNNSESDGLPFSSPWCNILVKALNEASPNWRDHEFLTLSPAMFEQLVAAIAEIDECQQIPATMLD